MYNRDNKRCAKVGLCLNIVMSIEGRQGITVVDSAVDCVEGAARLGCSPDLVLLP
jgi:hypothetical protein